MFRLSLKSLLMTTVCLTAAAAPAVASAESATPAAGEIVITGSRVRGVAPVGSSITALGRTDLENAARATLDRVIKDLPQVFDIGVSENSRGQSGGSGNIVYGNSINLRGIGPNATLILVDGHRVTNNSRSTDPSILPTLGVERVEIVADGASAIYGSDAVAGVVNLIPRRNLDGLEMFARGGISDDNVYHEWSAGAAFGKRFDRGQVMVAYEHVDKSNLNGADRPFFRSNQTGSGGKDYSVTRCAPGTIRAGANSYAIPPGGVTQATASSLVAGTSNRCDDLQGQDLIPSQRYDSVNGTASFEVTDWLTVFGDGFYSNRHFRRLPAFTSASLTVPQTNAFFVRPAGFAGTSYALDYNFINDVARNVSFGFGKSWQVTPGLRVKLPMDWQLEGIVGVGRTDDNSSTLLGTNNTALNAALASSNPATALDPYGQGRTASSVITGIFDQIFLAPTIGHFTGYEARLNGPLFKLPGGEVKLALGYEGQDFTVDLGSAVGGPTTPITYRTFSRKVDSGYAEVLLPVFGPDNAIGGFERLEIDAAVRYDHYSDAGSTTNPKVGVNWSPVRQVKIRGSYGTEFRAPSIPEIYGNSNRLFNQNYQNPAGGAPIPGVALSGANLNLKPETATTWSVGADVDVARNFRISATYFSVDYENKIVALLSDLAVLTRAAQYNGTGLIVQGAAAGQQVAALVAQGLSVAGPFPGGNPLNVTIFVDGRNQNLGRSITRGIDFTATYTWDASEYGIFNLGLNGTYLTEYMTQQSPGGVLLDQRNQIFQPLKFKARATLDWQKGPFGALVRVTHVGGYTNTAITPNESVSSYTPVDLNLRWKLTGRAKALTLGLEVRNLFDAAPPYVNIAPSVNGSGGYDATASDPVGRFIGASVRAAF
jgi:iron complex outermembrane receptor protein